jgi:hypothetical protein
MKRIPIAVSLLFAAVACSSQTAPAPTVTDTVTVVATPIPTVETAAPVAPTLDVMGTTWTMPNLVGRNLQDAQDEVQRITNDAIFYTGSTDLTGQGRNQVLDRNWQVCTSTPAPGEPITKDTRIDFGVVRIDVETCP